MDHKTLTDDLSRYLDVSADSVGKLIDGLATVFGECGVETDTISIPNFGVFEPKKRPERIAVHPASGKRLLIPPRILLGFKASPNLKQKVNYEK